MAFESQRLRDGAEESAHMHAGAPGQRFGKGMTDTTMKGFHLSPQQKRLWSLQQAEARPDAGGVAARTPYWSQAVLELSARPDPARLEAALARLVSRHELLRTSFASLPGMGLPLQIIGEQSPQPLVSWYDLKGRSLGRARRDLEQELEEARRLEVEWEQGVALRVAVMGPVGCGRWWVALSVPSMYGDRRGVGNIGRELARLYALDDIEDEETSEAEAIQYADLAEWQNELFESEETAGGREYWAGRGGGEKAERWRRWAEQYGSGGRTERGRREEADSGYEDRRVMLWPARVRIALGGAMRRAMAAAAGAAGVGVGEWALACWALLWSRLSVGDEVVIGTRFDGRNYEELKDALGLFERYLPIHLHLSGEMSFNELLQQITELTGDA